MRVHECSHSLLGLAGLVEAMRFLLELVVEEIGRELLPKRAWLALALKAKGWMVLHENGPPEWCSGIISFYKAGEDPAALHQKLIEAKIITSLRTDRGGQRYIRLSPHFYNTDPELEQVLERL